MNIDLSLSKHSGSLYNISMFKFRPTHARIFLIALAALSISCSPNGMQSISPSGNAESRISPPATQGISPDVSLEEPTMTAASLPPSSYNPMDIDQAFFSQAPGAYGFNYTPHGHDNWLIREYSSFQDRFEKDIALMKSMGVNSVRIMIAPHGTALNMFTFDQPADRKAWDMKAFNKATGNLKRIIRRLKEARIKVIVAIQPNVFYWYGPTPNSQGQWEEYISQECRRTDILWWQCRYPGRWSDFTWDYVDFVNSLVWQIENDEFARQNVLYYDPLNEIQTNTPAMQDFNRAVLGYNTIPPGRMGLSLLEAGDASITDPAKLKDILDQAGRVADVVDFHVYPQVGLPFKSGHVSVETYLDAVRASIRRSFPAWQTRLIIGEFASIYEGGAGHGQAELDARVIAWVKKQGDVLGALRWEIFDQLVGMASQAASIPAIRSTYMPMTQMRGRSFDGDFENGSGGWTSTAPLETLPNEAVTGQHYGRMKIIKPGQQSFCSPHFKMFDGWMLAWSGFFRTAVNEVEIRADFYGASGVLLSQDRVTLKHAGGWQWKPLLEQNLSKKFMGATKPDQARLCFTIDAPAGTSSSNPQYLDLDGLAAFSF